MLGAFLLGVLTKRANQRGVMTGMAVALAVMLFVWLKTPLAWTWYVLTGTSICTVVGYLVSLTAPASAANNSANEEDRTAV
jgi:SSS family solute:Na+ symporter